MKRPAIGLVTGIALCCPVPVVAGACADSIDSVRGTVGTLLMRAHEMAAGQNDAATEQGRQAEAQRIGMEYRKARQSLSAASTECAGDAKAIDVIHGLERDLQRLEATLNIEKAQ